MVGAGRGIGKELALQLCQFGVVVACVDINVETCIATVQRAQQLHVGVCKGYQCDVRSKDAVCTNILNHLILNYFYSGYVHYYVDIRLLKL